MPKLKSHRGAAKRFKVTGTGKLRRLQITGPKCGLVSVASDQRRHAAASQGSLRAPVSSIDAISHSVA